MIAGRLPRALLGARPAVPLGQNEPVSPVRAGQERTRRLQRSAAAKRLQPPAAVS
jgi:hypothetical protein